MKEIVRLLFNLRLVIQISSFRMVNLLCSGGHFSNITFINAKTKYESSYLLDVSQPYLQNHLWMSLGRPQDVGSTRSLELNIRPYWHIIITSAGGVLKMSVGNVLWHYIQDSTGTFFGCYIGTSSCRHISSTSEGCQQRTSSGCCQGTLFGVTYRTTWKHPQNVFWGRPQDVILPSKFYLIDK